MKKEIYYWSPFIGRVATVRSVVNSIIGFKRLKQKKLNLHLINCYGEWNNFRYQLKKEKVNIIDLQKKIKIGIDNYGKIYSRFVYLITFIISYNKLRYILKKNKPKFLIVHLLTYIPLVLFLNNKFKTKLILRISGKPKLNLFRMFLWKISNKNISMVFCPTKETIKYLKKKKIFDNKKIKFLPDPVIFEDEIKKLKKEKINFNLSKNSYFLCIGRLTKQKNHELLINLYKKFKINKKLIIIGDGELKSYLGNLIKKNKLEKKIFLMKYQKNIFHYIKKAKAVIIPSLWEDPGFVMIEAAFSKKPIISSNCPSGPKEFIGNNKGGYLFESNSLISLNNSIKRFCNSSGNEIMQKIIYSKKKSEIYTIENHTKILNRYLN